MGSRNPGTGRMQSLLPVIYSGAPLSPIDNLLLDGSGNIYGTTSEGGDCGFGVVFQLSPKSGGGEKYTVIHSFACSGDGAVPLSGMIFDAMGNLYGTTSQGGADQFGTVFKIAP